MILVLVPLVGVVLGVGLYAALRGAGVFNVLGADPVPRTARRAREEREVRSYRPAREWSGSRTSFGERIEGVPRGCLIAIIVAAGIWIVGWLIVLMIGLSLLS